ncbi:hypothetical protein PGT21_015177 [Puccinia graminis f. sp. tritici]|uniref:Uncharacterized protein n=1 Tax=Puccinia graminis f. sp. tritici TaxID=56615 RepID=A0A5B0R0N2_PUCGR|nr:hypothetical protein PGT21_015177 [Puccinia graminis f. sp. tritici]
MTSSTTSGEPRPIKAPRETPPPDSKSHSRIKALSPASQPHRSRLRQDQLDSALHLELHLGRSSTWADTIFFGGSHGWPLRRVGPAADGPQFCVDSTPASMWAPDGHKVRSTWSLESPITSALRRLAKDKLEDPHQRILDEAEVNVHRRGIDVSNKPTGSTSARMWDCGTNIEKKVGSWNRR